MSNTGIELCPYLVLELVKHNNKKEVEAMAAIMRRSEMAVTWMWIFGRAKLLINS
jgi:hypothetical protein